MMRALGTPILDLGTTSGSALLISDLHVPADGGVVLVRLRAAVAAATAARADLFVLGDLFDSYVCRAQVRHGVWRDVAAMFAEAAAAGVRIVLLHGNRDFLLGAEFERHSRARVVAGGVKVVLGGVPTLLLHGDELCVNDLPYQRAKRWLRSAPVRWLARSLPLAVALRVAARARAKSRMVIASGDQSRFLPTQAAVAAAFAVGVRRLVFGHIHRHAHGAFGDGDYWILPAFDEAGVGLRVDTAVAPLAFAPGAGPPEPTAVPPTFPFTA
ncbi:MAG: UDP-2,3-diacylglucosamine diphosphatase [Planctomycetes bacterium]|nr:UDP-2,3-diacylglucosamine diphosphatase [Planctomycetota bacterium]